MIGGTRRSFRALRHVGVILLAATGILAVWHGAEPVRAQQGDAPDPVAEGADLYQAHCDECHGPAGRGTPIAPPIADAGEASVYFWVSTGRMPIDHPDDPIRRSEPVLSEEQIRYLTAYLADLGDGPRLPDVAPDEADLLEGGRLYRLHCASCHGATGVGVPLMGVTEDGSAARVRDAPSLFASSSAEAAAAVRSGPGPMPAFGPDFLTDAEVGHIVAYVLELQDPPSPGGWSLGRWGPVTEGAVAWLFGLVLLIGAAWWIERPSTRGNDEG